MNLELDRISKSFGGQTVLQEISWSGDITSVAVIGPSGGGKSTLIRIIGGLLPADSGEIRLDGLKVGRDEKSLRSYRRNIGFVFQANGLFEHLTAAENVMLPLIHTFGFPKEDAAEISDRLFERFGLCESRKKYPVQLSGGQQQRVAIARAVAVRPKLLILDEPTSALDPEYTVEVLDMLRELGDDGIKSIIVTHEIGFAKNACRTVMFLADKRIVESGPSSEIFRTPKTAELRTFLDKILEWKV